MSDAVEDDADKKMPLLDHLVELRRRLIYAAVALLIAFFICFYFANTLFDFLVQPLANIWEGQEGRRLIFTALQEKFFTNVKVAFFAAAFIAFPIISAQLWAFIAPGLYRNEKGAFLPFLIATPILFFTGGAFVFYVVLPVAWRFFAGFEQIATGAGALSITLEPKVNEYLSLTMRLIFAFGLAFELPVALTLMARVGITSAAGLKKKRRYAVVLAFVAAAVLTPPDPISQLTLAIPIILLYEISIWCAFLVERQAAKRAARKNDEDDE